ncbi:MAG: preprotein translocase, YajC subunit [Actinotalea sp.]|nr:preprotein translocase, YajC subunit [Actinotalea sp.]
MDYSFLLILAIGFAFLWFTSRRTRKQQSAAADFRANLAPGQEVVTRFGMYGTIVALDDETVTLETSPGSTSRWVRAAVDRLVEVPADDADAEEDLEDEEYDEYEDGTDEVDQEDRVEGERGRTTPISTTTSSGLLEDDSPRPAVPDDASSLTHDPDAGDTRR